jgi:hypothetical protein
LDHADVVASIRLSLPLMGVVMSLKPMAIGRFGVDVQSWRIGAVDRPILGVTDMSLDPCAARFVGRETPDRQYHRAGFSGWDVPAASRGFWTT